MIDVKEAVNLAIKYFKDLYSGDYENLSLEEIEFNDSEDAWLVTLGFDIHKTLKYPFPSEKHERKYKIFQVDAENGSIKTMKIREV